MSNLLAALGRAQLSRLDSMINKRRLFRQRYKSIFEDVPGVNIFQSADDTEDNFWLTAILVNSEVTGWEPSELASYLAKENIESRPIWKPMHLQPVFKNRRSFLNGNSEQLFKRGLTLPSGSAMSEDQFLRVTDTIQRFLETKR
jgi:dTDP-4-amino-4,6-dideoxygalactose transaminase